MGGIRKAGFRFEVRKEPLRSEDFTESRDFTGLLLMSCGGCGAGRTIGLEIVGVWLGGVLGTTKVISGGGGCDD